MMRFFTFFIQQFYQHSMDIPSLNIHSDVQKYHQAPSLNDVCFRRSSNFLIPSATDIPYSPACLTYEQSFGQILTGTLQKKTLNSRWQSRFFVVTPLRLLYFADEQRAELKGCFSLVSLKQYHLKIIYSFPQINFTVSFPFQNTINSKTILILQILDQVQFNIWRSTLTTVLNRVAAQNYGPLTFPQIKVEDLLQSNQKIGKSNYNFWNHLVISKGELLNYVSHLDIIFLRSKSTFSNLHRFFMRSYYDHVAILFKDEAERAYLLQAIHEKGVTVSRLDNLFQSFHQEYEDMGYRKLLTTQNKSLPLEKLQQYINHLIGKKYQLSISKLLIDNQTDYVDSGDQAEDEPAAKTQKTYFCSQLVADIYLKFGVLLQGKSNHFWPKDFEQAFLPMSYGFYLSPLMKVQVPIVEERDRSNFEE